MTQEAFKTWWYNEGSQAPYTHHDCEEHTMRMCEIAWNKAQFLAQPEQNPVAWMFEFPDKRLAPKFDSAPHGGNWKPLYTTPPQRTWVKLMRGVRVEGDSVVISVKGGNEAARELCNELLKEKNT